MTPPEQRHIVAALTFELSKVETVAVRTRMLGHLDIIDRGLGGRVAAAMGMTGRADEITPARAPIDLPPSPALSILGKAVATLEGRKIGCLVADGFDLALVDKLRSAVTKAGAMFEIVAPRIGLTTAADGNPMQADHTIAGGPSVIFDAVAIVIGEDALAMLLAMPAARDWISDAYAHCKVIGVVDVARPLLDAAQAIADEGVIDLAGKGIAEFIDAAKHGRIWSREELQLDEPPRATQPPPPRRASLHVERRGHGGTAAPRRQTRRRKK